MTLKQDLVLDILKAVPALRSAFPISHKKLAGDMAEAIIKDLDLKGYGTYEKKVFKPIEEV
jgi:hypothetical protein